MIKKLLMIGALAFVLACEPPKKEENTTAVKSDEELIQLAEKLTQKFIIVDGHVDLPYRMEVKGFMLSKTVEDVSIETSGNFDYPKAKAGGLDAPFMSIYVPAGYQKKGGAKEFADSLIRMTKQVAETYPDKFGFVTTPSQIEENFKAGKISLPLGMENGAPIEDDVNNVKYFYDKGIRYVTLTHSKDNLICDSSYDTMDTHNGLSEFGVEVVKAMNDVGIMVDISHVSDSAFYQVLKVTKAPVIASHSSARTYTPGFERNMSDDMIKVLAENGGVIHINFGSTFLSKESRDKFKAMDEAMKEFKVNEGVTEDDSVFIKYKANYLKQNDPFADVKTAADHIDHVKDLVGIDYVAFGSDFDGVGNSLPERLKDVSMYPNLIFELLKRGYTEEEIEKICYKNTFRVWNKVIEVANS
ncbi:MAG: dipeptidase [bacterium]|nr:dipeptidase [bacterium]